MPNEEGNTPVVNEVAETQVAAPTESTPVETKAPVLDEDGIDISFAQNDGSEDADETPDESTPKPESEETEASEEAEESAEEVEDKPTKADARKEQLNTEIRDLVAQRNAIAKEVEALHAEVYKPASVDELAEQVNPETGEYYNRLEAQVEAMRQEREVERYNSQVSEARLTLANEAERAITDFPMFDAQSPEYNPAIAAQVDQLLASSLVIDPNTNQVIGARTSPYTLYKTVADAYNISAAKAAANGQKAVTKMMNQADVPSSAPVPKTTKDDSKLDADAYAAKHGLKMYEH